MKKETAMRVMVWRLAYLKGAIDKFHSKENGEVDLNDPPTRQILHPFTVESLEGIFNYSGGNPGIMLELLLRCLQDAIRGAEVLINEGHTFDKVLSIYQIDPEYVQRFVEKEVKRAQAEFTKFQTDLLTFLGEGRTLDEIEVWLQNNDKTWESVLEDFDLFEKQGLIFSPEAGRIQATELWTKGSSFV